MDPRIPRPAPPRRAVDATRLIDVLGDALPELRERASALLHSGHRAKADELLTVLRALEDDHPTTALLTVVCLIQDGRTEDAARVLDLVIESALVQGHHEIAETCRAWRRALVV